MNKQLGQDFDELEIADLIEESVANAAQRKQQMDNSLVDISKEEATNIKGGKLSPIPIILGFIEEVTEPWF
ncbi:MAG: hypothetical protein QNJ33_03375 [Crocosphaera sp.]|nr:hypothetical protein [Crocosphaera sp.]